MDKDNLKSTKYTDDEFQSLDIAYKYRDFCQDDYADYISCRRTHTAVLENDLIYFIPFGEYLSSCKFLKKQWEKCQKYREEELAKNMSQIFEKQKKGF